MVNRKRRSGSCSDVPTFELVTPSKCTALRNVSMRKWPFQVFPDNFYLG